MTQKNPTNFLKTFYKVLGTLSLIGLLIALMFSGRAEAVSGYSFGVIFVAVMVSTWDFGLGLALSPKNPSKAMGIFLIFIRYGLLGTLFYAMIALFVIDWFWFLAGTLNMLISMLITDFLIGKSQSDNKKSQQL